MKEVLAINIFVKGDDNDFLSIRRSKTDKFFPNMYALPGGGVETDENIEEAGKREFKEEVGTDLIEIDSKPSMESKIDMGSFILHIVVHKGKIADGAILEPKDDDIQYVKWIKPKEFLKSISENGYPEEELKKFKRFLSGEGFDLE